MSGLARVDAGRMNTDAGESLGGARRPAAPLVTAGGGPGWCVPADARVEPAAWSVLIAAVWHATLNLTSATDGAHDTVAAVVSTGVMLGAALIGWRLHRQTRGHREVRHG